MNQPPKPTPLGRGLSALFGDTDASYAPPQSIMRITPNEPAVKPGGAQRMPLTWLQPGSFQPRRIFGDASLKELSDSIRSHGIIEPLLVRPIKGQKEAYEIIAGERRWRAAQMAGLHDVPVLMRELTDREALEFGLIENIQRQDLSPLEEAEAYQRLMGEFNHSPEALSKIIGKSRPHIANLIRLLGLPVEVKQMVDEGKLSMGHARALVSSLNPVHFAKEVIEKGLNVRQTEALVKERAEHPEKSLMHKTGKNADTEMLEKELGKLLGLRINIKGRGKSPSITLFYKSLDQLDGIIKKLKG